MTPSTTEQKGDHDAGTPRNMRISDLRYPHPAAGASVPCGIAAVSAYCPESRRRDSGHEWAKRQAIAAGIDFTALDNGFASTSDPAALQALCDAFTPGTVKVWFERW